MMTLHVVITVLTGICGITCLYIYAISRTASPFAILTGAIIGVIYYTILYNFAINEEYAHFWIAYAIANIFGFISGWYDEQNKYTLKL